MSWEAAIVEAEHTPWGQRAEFRVVAAAARIEWRYLRAVGKRCAPLCVDHEGRALSTAEMTRVLRLTGDDRRPVLVVYWIRDALALAVLPFSESAVRHFIRSVAVLVDTTLAGRITGRLIELLGGRYRMLQPPGHADRLRRLHEIITERASNALAVDGRGPYRQMGTAVLSLASALDALVLPVAARASRTVTVAPRSKVRVPLPGCRIALVIGEPMSVGRGNARRVAAAQLRDALDGLGMVAQRVLGQARVAGKACEGVR